MRVTRIRRRSNSARDVGRVGRGNGAVGSIFGCAGRVGDCGRLARASGVEDGRPLAPGHGPVLSARHARVHRRPVGYHVGRHVRRFAVAEVAVDRRPPVGGVKRTRRPWTDRDVAARPMDGNRRDVRCQSRRHANRQKAERFHQDVRVLERACTRRGAFRKKFSSIQMKIIDN